MKQDTKDLIKGFFCLIGIFAYLGLIDAFLKYVLPYIFMVLIPLYAVIACVFLGGLVIVLGYSLFEYKKTYELIKEIDWLGIIEYIGAVAIIAAVTAVIVFFAKGLMASGFSNAVVANLSILLGFLIIVLFALYLREKEK